MGERLIEAKSLHDIHIPGWRTPFPNYRLEGYQDHDGTDQVQLRFNSGQNLFQGTRREFRDFIDTLFNIIVRDTNFPKQPPQTVEDPKPKELWQHKNGITYRIDMVIMNGGKEDEDHPPVVVYTNLTRPRTYSRPLSDWHRSFEKLD